MLCFQKAFRREDLDIKSTMLFTTFASLLIAASTALAQTPSGFLPAVNRTLDVYYGTTYISPGLLVKKSSKQYQIFRQARDLPASISHGETPRSRSHKRNINRKISPSNDRYIATLSSPFYSTNIFQTSTWPPLTAAQNAAPSCTPS
jgi:hypothetical protein